MSINIKSLQAKLLNLSKENGIDFQIMLNRFGAEQFLARLSQSPFAGKFIFKGGSLLIYLIDTDRKTKDLDFSLKQMTHHLNDLLKAVQLILEIPFDDGIEWTAAKGTPLNHPEPEMEYSGARIVCNFHLGKMRGQIRMDLALGDKVKAAKIVLPRMRYRGKPLIGEDFHLLAYPPETIFAEKLQIALSRKELNTRMKDYYDLYQLCHSELNIKELRQSIRATFSNRNMTPTHKIAFDLSSLDKLQTVWSRYRTKEKLQEAPENIADIIKHVNHLLNEVFEDG